MPKWRRDRRFEEIASVLGVDRSGWGWGASFFEYDHDGFADLMVTNGYDQYRPQRGSAYLPNAFSQVRARAEAEQREE